MLGQAIGERLARSFAVGVVIAAALALPASAAPQSSGDTEPPVTTATLSSSRPPNTAGWFNTSPVTVTLTVDDGSGSGVPAGNTWYHVAGDATWTHYTTPFAVGAPGTTTYEFYSEDAAGNRETPGTVSVHVDTEAPTTAANVLCSSAAEGWQKTPQTVTLTSADVGDSGLAETCYAVDGAPQIYSGPFLVSSQGSHAITYWSVDNAGNSETIHTGYVNIDATAPRSTATRNAVVISGRQAVLPFRITDPAPSCGKATVTITIKRGHKIVKKVTLSTAVSVDMPHSYSFGVKLAKGTYTWTVKATDIAGNAGRASVAKDLIVNYLLVPILVYHHVTPVLGGSPLLYVSPTQFASQLAHLHSYGYHVVTLRQAYDAWTTGAALPAKPVILSFDDGYQDQYFYAAPLLRRYHYQGELYVVVGNLGAAIHVDMVKQMIKWGWEIGSHSITHPDLRRLSASALHRELVGSRNVLRRLFHVPIDFFCYPGGNYNAGVAAAVRKAGYLAATTTEFGRAEPPRFFTLPRITVWWGESLKRFAAHLQGLP
jgi:peptidoglycan/xylan/chitin deacetylase (PgdA/CDA1 family)